jgi:hypothetical protein
MSILESEHFLPVGLYLLVRSNTSHTTLCILNFQLLLPTSDVTLSTHKNSCATLSHHLISFVLLFLEINTFNVSLKSKLYNSVILPLELNFTVLPSKQSFPGFPKSVSGQLNTDWKKWGNDPWGRVSQAKETKHEVEAWPTRNPRKKSLITGAE